MLITYFLARSVLRHANLLLREAEVAPDLCSIAHPYVTSAARSLRRRIRSGTVAIRASSRTPKPNMPNPMSPKKKAASAKNPATNSIMVGTRWGERAASFLRR